MRFLRKVETFRNQLYNYKRNNYTKSELKWFIGPIQNMENKTMVMQIIYKPKEHGKRRSWKDKVRKAEEISERK